MEELAELDPLCSEYSIYIPDTTLHIAKKQATWTAFLIIVNQFRAILCF